MTSTYSAYCLYSAYFPTYFLAYFNILSVISCIFSCILMHILFHILHILFHIRHIHRHILHMSCIFCIYMQNIARLSICPSLVSIGFNENSVKLCNCRPSAPELGHERACIERRLSRAPQRGLLRMAQPPQHQLPCRPHALRSKLSIPP